MILRLYISIILLYTFAPCHAQHGANWVFGFHSGIDFNKSPAQPIYTSIIGNSDTVSSNYSQSYSHCNGQLLMYVGDRGKIWNKEHKLMPSYNLLDTTYQESLFVPLPGDDSIIYLFQCNSNIYKFSYAIIDLKMDSGRGDVRQGTTTINDSNIMAFDFIKHANDTDYWILQKTNAYDIRAYLLTSTGLASKPVMSSFIGDWPSGQSVIKVNNSGTMIVSNYHQKTSTLFHHYIYDFDKAKGTLSNKRTAIVMDYLGNQRFAFSPNDSILYMHKQLGPKSVYKDSVAIYQIPAYDPNPYKKVKEVFRIPINSGNGSMQLGSDNRIYVNKLYNDTTKRVLSFIPYPDQWGNACGFVLNGFYVLKGTNIINGKFPCYSFPVKRINNKFNITGANGCGYDTVRFTADADSAFKSYNWYFGDGDSAVGKSVVHQYKKPGSYYVKLACELGNCGYMQWVGDSVSIKFKPTVSLSTNKTIYCGEQTVDAQINYRYSDTLQIAWGDGTDTLLYVADTNLVDSTQLQHTYNKTGNYAISCKAWNSNCYDSVATIYHIIIDTLPKSSFAADYITSCGAKSITLTDTSKFDSIIVNRAWHIYKASGLDTTITTGTTNNVSVLFNDTGVYSVKLIIQSKQGCIDSLEKINYIQINSIPVSKINGKTSWCGTDSTTLTVTGGMGYIWSNGDTTASIFLKPVTSNYYSVVVTNVYNCSVKDSVYISVGKIVTPFFASNYITSCGNSTITLTDSSGGRDSIIQQRKWTIEFPNNIIKQYDTASSNKLKLIVQDTGYYNAKLVYIAKQGCLDSLYKTKVFRILPQPAVYIDSPSHNPLCFGDSFMLTAQQRDTAYPPLVSYKWNTGQVSTKSIKVDSANSYYVAAINSVGCGAQSNTVKISFLPQLFANIKKATDSLYVVTTRKIISYSWHKDSIVYNTSSSLYHPPSGRYYVQVMDANGCEASSGSLLYTTNIGYIGEEENGIRVYPNPASDILYVEWSSHVGNGSTPLTTTNMRQSGKTTILMYDMLGRCAIQLVGDGSTPLTTTNQRQHTIYVGDLPKGFYILRVGENPDSYRVKVLVE